MFHALRFLALGNPTMPHVGTQIVPVRVLPFEEDSSDSEFEIVFSPPCTWETRPDWPCRLQEAFRCGWGVGSYLSGETASLPTPQRWPSYKNHFWVVFAPGQAPVAYIYRRRPGLFREVVLVMAQ